MYIPQTINMRLGNKVMEKSPVYVVVDTVKNVLSPFQLSFLLLCLRMMLLNHP